MTQLYFFYVVSSCENKHKKILLCHNRDYVTQKCLIMYRIEVYKSKLFKVGVSECSVKLFLVSAVEIQDQTQVGFVVTKLSKRFPNCHLKVYDLDVNCDCNTFEHYDVSF